MAVGDFVNNQSITSSLNFQPASGVTVMITHCGVWSNYVYLGTTSSSSIVFQPNSYTYTQASAPTSTGSKKFFINNTNYILLSADGTGCFYCGVQVA